MIKTLKSRLDQLESRLRKVVFKHKEIHAQCFPKDGSEGVYKKVSRESHDKWEKHPLNLYLDKSHRVSSLIRREMLAIIYYMQIMESKTSVFTLVNNTIDTINKYNYLFIREKVDVSIMYPKTEAEIKKAGLTYLEKLKRYPEEKNWSMFSKEGNMLVTKMMIEVVEGIQSDKRVTVESIQEKMKPHIEKMCKEGHSEVHDTAVREAVLITIDRQLEKAGYSFEIDEY